MNYEQKYKEALKRARDMLSYKEVRQEDMEYLFPELKSEDERIRKALIAILKSDFETDTTIYDISVGEIIAWLEKQKSAKLDEKYEEAINMATIALEDMSNKTGPLTTYAGCKLPFSKAVNRLKAFLRK